MQRSISMLIDEKLLSKAKKIAREKNTSINNLIRNYLSQLVDKENMKKEDVVSELETIFDNSQMRVGDKNWRRDQLYER